MQLQPPNSWECNQTQNMHAHTGWKWKLLMIIYSLHTDHDASLIWMFILMPSQAVRRWWGEPHLHVDDDARANWDFIINVKLGIDSIINVRVEVASSWIWRFRLHHSRADFGIMDVQVEIGLTAHVEDKAKNVEVGKTGTLQRPLYSTCTRNSWNASEYGRD